MRIVHFWLGGRLRAPAWALEGVAVLKDSLTKLYRATESGGDPRQMARVVMARQFLNAQKPAHREEGTTHPVPRKD